MPDKRKILILGQSHEVFQKLVEQGAESLDLAVAGDVQQLLDLLGEESYDGVFVAGEQLQQTSPIGPYLQSLRILEAMPDGVALIDKNNAIVWANERFRQWCDCDPMIGQNIYTVLGRTYIVGPDYCPLNTARRTAAPTTTTLRCNQDRYYHLHAAPAFARGAESTDLIVTLRDVTDEHQRQQQLEAIYLAGAELANVPPEDLLDMSVEQRIALLKENIIRCTKDLLHFDIMEIRLLDRKTQRLEPLVSVGLAPEAANRELYALPQGNGITGFVAATGKSYLCEVTDEDPLFLEGIKGAKSALTVPIKLHDEVIGTFNVESPRPQAFTHNHRQFLEAFAHQVAAALNTLELLGAGQAVVGAATVEAIHRAVALPVDEILNDAVAVMKQYVGQQPELEERLGRILKNARDIKEVIQQVGAQMTPSTAYPADEVEQRPALRGLRVLVVDNDVQSRTSAHNLLEPYGCAVEGASSGECALALIRVTKYDAIIFDVLLPDMPGDEFMQKVMDLWADGLPPLIFAQGQYDRHHTMVKARQAGFRHFLSKDPFPPQRLLDAVEAVVGCSVGS